MGEPRPGEGEEADFGVMAMKSSRVIQNPFNRRQTIPERVKALDALVPQHDGIPEGLSLGPAEPEPQRRRRGHQQHGDGQGRHPLAFEKKS